ncbi:hypothetical protein BVI2075_160040 [Burkholderia vietnamiensis]|nr:hypothetical protein BVI2075_160040 [Burkholderia vietnamiensis]
MEIIVSGNHPVYKGLFTAPRTTLRAVRNRSINYQIKDTATLRSSLVSERQRETSAATTIAAERR